MGVGSFGFYLVLLHRCACAQHACAALCALEAVSCIVALPNLSPDLLHLAH